MIPLPKTLQAARFKLVHERPYLATALWALVPVAKPGLGTMAVDKWWRLYYDPAAVEGWTPDEVAGVLYHEVCHLLRSHPERMVHFNPQVANLATDAEINDNLLEEKVILPSSPVTPQALGLPPGRLAEEYVVALTSAAELAPEAQSTQEDGTAIMSTAQAGSGAGAAAPSSHMVEGSGQVDAPPLEDRGDVGETPQGDESDSQSGSSSGSSSSSSQAPTRPMGDRATGGADARSPGDKGANSTAEGPQPGHGRCGSCAHGHPEAWEDAPPAEGGTAGVSPMQGELIRRAVAEAIRTEGSAGRGSVPGHWRRWADTVLSPKVDWRRQLAAEVRAAMADVAGAVDYTYRRPSRRQAVAGPVILPALRHPTPEVAIVVDTSGSMGDRELSQALAEVSGVLRAVGAHGATVLSVDTAVHTCQRAFDARQIVLAGGGGTDMGRGIDAAAKLRPRPHVIIVLTDGDTPWPALAPAGMRVVVALLGRTQHSVPTWARVVEVRDGH